MSCNIGNFDRTVRIVVGLALIVIAVVFAQPWAYIGIIPVLTGIIRFCPLYSLLNIKTSCDTQNKK